MKKVSYVLTAICFAYWGLVIFSFFNEVGVALTIGVLAAITFHAFEVEVYIIATVTIGIILTIASLSTLWESHK